MKRIYIALFAAILAASCAQEAEVYQPDTTLYTQGTVNLCASIEEVMTKMTMDPTGRGMWVEGDKIAVACSDGTFVDFELNGTGETKRAVFTGTLPEGKTLGKIAVWPTTAVAGMEGDNLTLKMPVEYATDNIAFDGIMVANITDSWEVTFRHVTSRPTFRIEGVPSYTSYIILEAEGWSLGGRMTMDVNDENGVPGVEGAQSLKISLVEAGNTPTFTVNMPVGEYPVFKASLYDAQDKLIHAQQLNEAALLMARATTSTFATKLVGLRERFDPVDVEFIEVCGIKWAKGNLQALKGEAQKGMQDGWRIAPYQWHNFGYDLTEVVVDKNTYTYNPDKATEMRYKNSTNQFEHFNLGGLARNARFYSATNWLMPENSSDFDITGKIYTDVKGGMEAEDQARWANSGTFTSNNSSVWGDLAFWASRGAYRTPTYAEMDKLLTEAHIQVGWIETKDFGDEKDFKVWGVLFTDPAEGQGVGIDNIVKTERKFTVEELEGGLFLPKSGRRNNASSDTIINARVQGTYRTTTFIGDGECTSGAKGEHRWYAYAMHIAGSGISWQKNIGSAYDTAAGFLIRPIVNDDYDPENI